MGDSTTRDKIRVQPGTKPAPDKYRIEIAPDGPYLVYGQPPLKQQFIMPDREGQSWTFKSGASYSTENEPTALCRCGQSANKPYCDGTHVKAQWKGPLARPDESILDDAQEYRGPRKNLTDNQKYCAFARFCDPKGQVWNLVGVDTAEAAELTVRESDHCPAGRLSAWDKGSSVPHEPAFEPSLGLIEDPAIGASGPIWVRGGIKIKAGDYTYEVRNRATLCRCGHTSNGPFCNGAHASAKWKDGLPTRPDPDGEEW